MDRSSLLSFRLSTIFGILILSCLAPSLTAQETSEKVSQPAQAADSVKAVRAREKPTSPAAKAKADQQKALALSLLMSLANDARSFSDQKLRARTLARIADGLWEADPDQSRSLFQKAWDAAESADQDAARQVREDRQRQEAAGRGVALVRPPDLRSEVLRLAARRDRALGEDLLDKLKQSKAQEATEATGRRDPFAPPDSQAQRLNLAGQLLDVDVPRALQFADPALTAISMQGSNFLSFLRDKDPAAADQRYLRMLSRAAADLESDANTVSLLSSYLFTPHMFFTFDNQGGTSSSQMGRPTSPPTPTPELRNAFFQVAAQILTRPLAPPEQDRTTTGLEGKYLVIKRLMPLFEQYAAPQTTDMLRGQLAALGANVRDELRKRDDDVMRRGIRPEEDSADREQTLRDHIERAKTSEERDQLYIELIMLSLRKGDTGARDLVEKIEDSDLRKQVRPYVDVSLVINAVDKKQVEDAHRLALSGELTHFQRVWALTQVARQLTETDREKALTVLEAAAEEARRIDGSDADRPRALIGVANALFALDRTRSWELVTESVKAANSANGFTGEDARIMLRLQTANITQVRSNSAENFDLPSIFRVLTKDSYDRAVALARNFEGDSPRATALISIARTVLEQN